MGFELAKDFVAVVGVPGALIAAWKAIEEFKNGNIEKAKATAEKSRENRHKQATAARDMLREIFNSGKSRAAMQMLDWSGRTYQDGSLAHEIRFAELGSALRIEQLTFNPKERYIRDCFENFFDRLELVQHYINIEFIHFEDVAVPFAYYAKKVTRDIEAFEPFLDHYGYPRAKQFLQAAGKST